MTDLTFQRDDRTTIVAAGVLAVTLAAVCHETLGHGLGCFIDGGRITLLTSIWFRCRGAMSITDAGGPIGSLVVGMAAMAMLSMQAVAGVTRLFLVLFAAFSLFWFAGQLITHPLGNQDDWYFVARRMGWPWIWRPIMMSAGVAMYAATVWMLLVGLRRDAVPSGHAIRLGYGAAVVSAVIAGLMWSPAPIISAKEEFTTLGLVPLGLLFIARARGRSAGRIARSWWWIAGAAVVYGVFLLIQARGVGPLANIGLR